MVQGNKAELAVECYGDHWHGLEKFQADTERQRKLERCGWRFFIIRESLYRANKEVALDSLWALLEEMGIQPVTLTDDNGENESSVR